MVEEAGVSKPRSILRTSHGKFDISYATVGRAVKAGEEYEI
jgi:hypothetical protein